MNISPEMTVIDPRDRGGKAQPLLTVQGLTKHFPVRGGVLNRKIATVQALSFGGKIDSPSTIIPNRPWTACQPPLNADMPEDVVTPVRPPRYFEWITLLKQCTAFEAYCKVYTAEVEPAKIAEFLIFDPLFPHSIRFSVDRVQEELGCLGVGGVAGRRVQAERLAGRLKASLDYGQVDELMAGDIDGFLRNIQSACKQIHKSVYDAFIGYSVDELLPG